MKQYKLKIELENGKITEKDFPDFAAARSYFVHRYLYVAIGSEIFQEDMNFCTYDGVNGFLKDIREENDPATVREYRKYLHLWDLCSSDSILSFLAGMEIYNRSFRLNLVGEPLCTLVISEEAENSTCG